MKNSNNIVKTIAVFAQLILSLFFILSCEKEPMADPYTPVINQEEKTSDDKQKQLTPKGILQAYANAGGTIKNFNKEIEEGKETGTSFVFSETFHYELDGKDYDCIILPVKEYTSVVESDNRCKVTFTDKSVLFLDYYNTITLSIEKENTITGFPNQTVEIEYTVVETGHGKLETNLIKEEDGVSFDNEFNSYKNSGKITVFLNNSFGTGDAELVVKDNSGNKVSYYFHASVNGMYFRNYPENVEFSGKAGERNEINITLETNFENPEVNITLENEEIFSIVSTDIVYKETNKKDRNNYIVTIAVETKLENRTGVTSSTNLNIEVEGRYTTSTRLLQWTLPPQKKDGFVYFEDWNFKKAVLETGDTDGDKELSFEEALNIRKIDASNRDVRKVTGIEAFKNIEWLDLSNNKNLEPLCLDNIEVYSKLKYINLAGSYNGGNFDGCYAGPGLKIIWNDKGETIDPYGRFAKYYKSTDFSHDNNVVTVQNHTKGDGIILYLEIHAIDKDYESGAVWEKINGDLSFLFNTAPLRDLKEYFDVYVRERVDIDNLTTTEAGYGIPTFLKKYAADKYIMITTYSNGEKQNNRFNTPYNTYGYAGLKSFTNIFLGASNASRFTILRHDFATLTHEIGHALGDLKDQYEGVYYYDKTNSSSTNDPEKVPWTNFLKLDQYKGRVGIYAHSNGGYYPSKCGSECRNLMGNQPERSYFDSVCRYHLYKNTILNSGIETDENKIWQMFLEYDMINNDIPE